jgi:hypothetical protein
MGVVDTQIDLYNRLKRSMPTLSENEILNKLILSRIKSFPTIVSREEDRAYYQPLLDKFDKTLEEVILKIVHYEFIETRTARIQRIPIEHVVKFQCAVAKYIQEQIRNSAEGVDHGEVG